MNVDSTGYFVNTLGMFGSLVYFVWFLYFVDCSFFIVGFRF